MSRPGNESVLVIACGALGRELHAIRRANGWDHLRIRCLDPALHLRPAEIAPRLRTELERARGQYQRIFIGYADCGSYGGIDRVLADFPGVERLPGLHCYDAFAGAERIERWAEDEPGTFYLTDFLVRSFDRLVVEALGLDRHPELLDALFRKLPAHDLPVADPGFRFCLPRPRPPRPGWVLRSPTSIPATAHWKPASSRSPQADAWTPCWFDGATSRRRSSSSRAGSAPRCC